MKSIKVSDCCKQPIKELMAYKRVADKHYKYFAVQLPVGEWCIICTCCHNLCESVNELVNDD